MVIDSIYNLALLLSLSAIYAIFPFKKMKKRQNHSLLVGLIIGFAGIMVMSRPSVLSAGIVFDSRSILLSVSGMFFGAVPTVVAAAAMGAYRIFLGGAGAYSGVAVIVLSACAGLLWHHWRFPQALERPRGLAVEFYLVGVATHVGMLACMLLLPEDLVWPTLKRIALPVLGIYPVGTCLLGLVLLNQLRRLEAVARLGESERRFKTVFEQAPIGICLTDSETGVMREVNGRFLEIVGRGREEVQGIDWMGITHPEDVGEDERLTARLVAGEIGSFTMDKRYERGDGTYVWTSMSAAALQGEGSLVKRHLCMIADITERKEAEERIVHANTHDCLTGLHNRSHFEGYLRESDRAGNFPLTLALGDR